jgi:hypothetical protein
VAGVADQLQTNFAGDLRNILKCVFLMNASEQVEVEKERVETTTVEEGVLEEDALSIDTGMQNVEVKLTDNNYLYFLVLFKRDIM